MKGWQSHINFGETFLGENSLDTFGETFLGYKRRVWRQFVGVLRGETKYAGVAITHLSRKEWERRTKHQLEAIAGSPPEIFPV